MTPCRKLGTVPRPKCAACRTMRDCGRKVSIRKKQTDHEQRLPSAIAHQAVCAPVGCRDISAPSSDLNDYFEQFPEDVFVALEDFVELVASGSANDNLVAGHLLLILGLLERIRFRCDRGYEDAIGLVEKFQHTVADLSATGGSTQPALSMVTSALHQAGIAASPELTEAVATSAKDFVPLQSAPNLAAVLDDLAKECRGDPFAVASMIAETGHVMPADGRALIAVEQMRSANPVIREAAALLLLDPEPEVRGGRSR